MKKQQFIESFATTFMAAWAANNYTECCMMGEQERLSHPPVEDAFHLAEEAWKEMRKTMK